MKLNNKLKALTILLSLIFWCVHFVPSCMIPAIAVVPTTNSTSTATGDGVTNTFTFTFELLQASDLTVYVAGSLQTQNVAYIVTPTGGSYPCTGGTITFQATYTPANSAAILMARSLTLTQTIALPVEGALPSSTLQTVFDRACMQIQQLNTATSLCLQLPITSVGVNTALPTPVALNVIGWDNTGANVVNYTPQAIVANVTSIGLGNVVGPATSTVGHIALFNNTSGTLLSDLAPGASGNVATSNGSQWTSSTPQEMAIYNNVRAYLVSGSPYADGSSSGNATLYVGPTQTGKYQTWDNGSGVLTTSVLTETSFSLSSLVATNAYDIYLYNNSGTWTVEADQWSNTTTPLATSTDAAGRATKNGSTNKLLVAQVCCDTTSGKVYNYAAGDRALVNVFNRIRSPINAAITTTSWSYASNTWRASDANTTNGQGRVGIFAGSQTITLDAVGSQVTQGNYAGVGLNIGSTSATPAAIGEGFFSNTGSTAARLVQQIAGGGLTYLQLMEAGNTSVTMYGNSSGFSVFSGNCCTIEGWVEN